MTDDCAVIVERNEAAFAIELRTEESEAGRVGGHGVSERDSAAVTEYAEFGVQGADGRGGDAHGERSQRVAACASVRGVAACVPVSRAGPRAPGTMPCAPTRGRCRRAQACGSGRSRVSRTRVNRGQQRPPRGRLRDRQTGSRRRLTGRRGRRRARGGGRVRRRRRARCGDALARWDRACRSLSGSGARPPSARARARAPGRRRACRSERRVAVGTVGERNADQWGVSAASWNEKPAGATATGQGAPCSSRSVTAPGSTRPTCPRREDPMTSRHALSRSARSCSARAGGP